MSKQPSSPIKVKDITQENTGGVLTGHTSSVTPPDNFPNNEALGETNVPEHQEIGVDKAQKSPITAFIGKNRTGEIIATANAGNQGIARGAAIANPNQPRSSVFSKE